MKRIISLLLILVFLPIPVKGAEEKYVALTFDDGPAGRFTRRLLPGLAELNAQATFFLCGYRLEQYPTLAGEILEGGHEIGLHGYSHNCMSCMSPEQLAQELDKTAGLLMAQTGSVSCLLRPPGGKASQAVLQAAQTRGLSIIRWSVDPRDWATQNSAAVIRRVLDTVKDGDIILLHDMSDSSVDAALEIVRQLQAQGYRFVTVTQLSALRSSPLAAGRCYSAFYP